MVAVVSGIVGHVVGDEIANVRTGDVGQHALVIDAAEVVAGRAVVDDHIAEFGCGVEDIARGADCADRYFADVGGWVVGVACGAALAFFRHFVVESSAGAGYNTFLAYFVDWVEGVPGLADHLVAGQGCCIVNEA